MLHQTFFSLTELFSTGVIFTMCSKNSELDPRKILVIISISSVHLIVGGIDQFFVQLILGQGHLYQKVRNLGFLLPDLVHIVLPLWAMKRHNKQNRIVDAFGRRDLKISWLSVCLLVVIGRFIL